MKALVIVFVFATQLFSADLQKKEPTGKFFIVNGKAEEFSTNKMPIKEISIMEDYTLVLKFENWEPQKRIVSKLSCFNPEKKRVISMDLAFQPDEPAGSFGIPFKRAPDDAPGLYRWTLEVPGMKTFEETLSLLPETPDGIEKSPVHEKAAENVFRAFASFWLGFEDDFYFVLTGYGETKRVTVTNYYNVTKKTKTREKPADFTLEVPWAVGTGAPYYLIEVEKEDVYLWGVHKLLHVKGLEYNFSRNWTFSPAEKLNGITYKGSAQFTFSVSRVYEEEKGWSDWIDSRKGRADYLNNALPLNFTILERDGNWFVTATDSGTKFVNGKLVERGKTEVKLAPPIEQVREFLEQGKNFGREELKNIGRATRLDPEKVEQEAVNTIFQLRKRTVGE